MAAARTVLLPKQPQHRCPSHCKKEHSNNAHPKSICGNVVAAIVARKIEIRLRNALAQVLQNIGQAEHVRAAVPRRLQTTHCQQELVHRKIQYGAADPHNQQTPQQGRITALMQNLSQQDQQGKPRRQLQSRLIQTQGKHQAEGPYGHATPWMLFRKSEGDAAHGQHRQ